ncbi:MAG: acetyl-CoA hydrolase/transferase C-terminal domain-containing protein [Reyranella sp.]|nr:acetyl-CoA hydrolase/transferase C-terminal domain-containing protein [Reyranella sp.]
MRFDDADRLAQAILDRVGPRIVLALPLGLGKANHIANALYARAASDPSIHLSIFTGLTLEKPRPKLDLERRFLGPLSRRLFDGYPDLAYAAALRRGTLPPNIEVDEFFFRAGQWLGVEAAQQHYVSTNYTHVVPVLLQRGVNVVAQLVAHRRDEEHGDTYSLACNTDLTLDMLDARRRGAANFVLAGQVNSELPFMPGEASRPAAEFDFVLDSAATDFPLFAPPREPIDLVQYACGLHAASTVADGGTVQLGIGALGDAVAHGLVLRQTRNEDFRALLEELAPPLPPGSLGGTPDSTPDSLAPFTAGLYACTEMFVEAFLDLHRAKILTREADGAVLHAGFFLGSRSFNKALSDMPEAERAKFQMRAISFVNELYGDEAAKRRARVGGRFINATMMVTLLGEAISETLDDGRVVSGVGGQYNFVSQSFALDGARSILVAHSTKTRGGRTTSNIRWGGGHITIPRHLRDVVITEYGIADLRGRADRDVVAAMLSIADSRFQGELLDAAKRAGKIEKGYEIPEAQRHNMPERLAAILGRARVSGLLPAFPFGSDMTPVEQRLAEGLRSLAAASLVGRAKLFLAGIRPGPVSEAVQAGVQRMGLAHPRTLQEFIYRTVVCGVLNQSA